MSIKPKKIILLILFIILSSAIFFFSNQNGASSIKISDTFTSKVLDKYSAITKDTLTPKEKKKIILKSRFLVRKLAHFTIYLTLGILVYLFIKCYNFKHPLLLSIIFCFLFACADEFHQIFTPGRTARFYDVLIDTLGCLVGILLVLGIKKIHSLISKKKKEVKKYA